MFGWRKPSAKPDKTKGAPVAQTGAAPLAQPDPIGAEAMDDGSSLGIYDLSDLVAAIEALASHIYAAHGLPSQPGHYRRSEEAEDWSLISQSLSPAEKFDLILAAPQQAGFRYATHDRIGARHESRLVRQASALISAARGVRNRVTTGAPITHQTLADCIRMGALYQALADQMPEFEAKDFSVTPRPDLWSSPEPEPEA